MRLKKKQMARRPERNHEAYKKFVTNDIKSFSEIYKNQTGHFVIVHVFKNPIRESDQGCFSWVSWPKG